MAISSSLPISLSIIASTSKPSNKQQIALNSNEIVFQREDL